MADKIENPIGVREWPTGLLEGMRSISKITGETVSADMPHDRAECRMLYEISPMGNGRLRKRRVVVKNLTSKRPAMMVLVVCERKSTLDASRWSNELGEVEAWWRGRCTESEPVFYCEIDVDVEADETSDEEDDD